MSTTDRLTRNRLTRRGFLQMSATLSAGALLAACTSVPASAPATGDTDSTAPAAAQTTILVWDGFGEGSEAIDELFARYNESQSDVVVTREAQANMRDIIRTALDAGSGPDIMNYDTGPGFAGVLARAGLLMPLDDAYHEYNWTERILPIARNRTVFDGVTYGIGHELEFVGTFYNERLFEEHGLTAPETHDEFLAVCNTLSQADLIPVSFGNQNKWPAGHTFSVFSGNIAGIDKLAAAISGEVPWNDPEFVEAIQLPFVDMNQAGCYNSDINAITYDDSNLLFYSGQAAMRLTGSWMIGNFTDDTIMADPVGFFFYPSIRGNEIAPPAGLGSGYFIARQTQAPEASLDFMNFLFSESAASNWLEGMNMIPPLHLDVDEYNISPLLRFVIEELETNADSMGYNIDVLTPDNFNTMMFDGFQEVIGGVKTAEQQANDLEAAMQTARDEGRVMDITD